MDAKYLFKVKIAKCTTGFLYASETNYTNFHKAYVPFIVVAFKSDNQSYGLAVHNGLVMGFYRSFPQGHQ